MGITKTEAFSEGHNEIAGMMKALAHPARVAIIDYLLSVDACICGDIVNVLPLAQPTVSQHLKELKNAGLIKGSIEGKSICYCVEEKAIQKLMAYLGKVTEKINNKCCE